MIAQRLQLLHNLRPELRVFGLAQTENNDLKPEVRKESFRCARARQCEGLPLAFRRLVEQSAGKSVLEGRGLPAMPDDLRSRDHPSIVHASRSAPQIFHT